MPSENDNISDLINIWSQINAINSADMESLIKKIDACKIIQKILQQQK